MSEQGLYAKYTITNNETGQEVKDAFVLKPIRDPYARIALRAYASACRPDNPDLAADIERWLQAILTDALIHCTDWHAADRQRDAGEGGVG